MKKIDDKLVGVLAEILQVNAEHNVKIDKIENVLGRCSSLDGLYLDLLPLVHKLLDIDETELVVDDFFGHIKKYTSLKKCLNLIHSIVGEKTNKKKAKK